MKLLILLNILLFLNFIHKSNSVKALLKVYEQIPDMKESLFETNCLLTPDQKGITIKNMENIKKNEKFISETVTKSKGLEYFDFRLIKQCYFSVNKDNVIQFSMFNLEENEKKVPTVKKNFIITIKPDSKSI